MTRSAVGFRVAEPLVEFPGRVHSSDLPPLLDRMARYLIDVTLET